MADGFRAVFEDLHRAAGKIEDAVQAAAGLPWQGPGGDYGHRGVQAGWTQFIEDAKAEIETLCDKAVEHSDGLRTAAQDYQDADDETGFTLGDIGDLLAPDDGTVGGGFTGGIKDVVGRVTGRPASAGDAPGFMSPERSAELFPDEEIADRLDPGLADPRAY